MFDALSHHVVAALLVSLRVAPTLSFAPPFTLLKIPVFVRVLLSLALGFWLTTPTDVVLAPQILPATAIGELTTGIAIALSLQIVFAALMAAGRALDIQVGFGLAQVADPALRTQMPLLGAVFAYAAGLVFFANGGLTELVAIWGASLQAVPMGGPYAADIPTLLNHLSASFVLAFGLASAVFLTVFIVDLTVAFMSRTLPQMNVLVLGFQAKVFALLITLPFVIGGSGAFFLRIVRLALDAAPRLI